MKSKKKLSKSKRFEMEFGSRRKFRIRDLKESQMDIEVIIILFVTVVGLLKAYPHIEED
jgi:hypothetical protein